jgi:hypothetical protein
MRRSALIIAAVAIAAACAPMEPAGPVQAGAQDSAQAGASRRQCFNAANVTGFRQIDARTVDLNVGASRVFRVELVGTCPEVREAVSLGVRARSGSSFICDDLDVELIVPSSVTGPRVCPAVSLRQRTPAELESERAARR